MEKLTLARSLKLILFKGGLTYLLTSTYRYIENPYLIGGKKFDIRAYALVTSYYPLVVYIHRNGFCRFSNSQFSMNVKDITNLYIHATNVAIQKQNPNYDGDKGCKWLLRNLKLYLLSKHEKKQVEDLFTEMEALIVRSLMSVQKVMINDKHCFELYGYDILIDKNLKPYFPDMLNLDNKMVPRM
jgi:tubulin polyglutamylase TTLL9